MKHYLGTTLVAIAKNKTIEEVLEALGEPLFTLPTVCDGCGGLHRQATTLYHRRRGIGSFCPTCASIRLFFDKGWVDVVSNSDFLIIHSSAKAYVPL